MTPRTLILWLTLAASFSPAASTFPEFQVETTRDYLQAVSQVFLTQAGTNAQTLFIQATLWSQFGRKDEAERLARLALEMDPARPEIHSFLASLFIRQDRLSEAAQSLRHALQIEPNLPGAHRQLGMALDRLGEHQQAHAAFVAALRLDPTDATAQLLLGQWLLEQDRAPEAVTQLEAACQADPESANAHYALFQAQNRTGEAERARETLLLFQRLRANDKSTSDSRLETFDNAHQMRTMAALFHASAANVLLRQGKDAPAEAHLRQATQVCPDSADALDLLTDLLLRQKRFEEARAVFENLTHLHPGHIPYRVNLSTVLLQLKDYSGAVRILQEVLDLDPGQPQALNNLARFYLGAGRELPAALSLCRRLVELHPSAANYDLLAWGLYANGHPKEAVAASAQAVNQEPANPVYQERYRRLSQPPTTTP